MTQPGPIHCPRTEEKKPGTSFRGKKSSSEQLFFQPKLTVVPADDVYEREADVVADRIMRTEEPEEIQTKAIDIQRKCSQCDEEQHLQRKDSGNQENETETPSVVNEVINSAGHSMEKGTASFMESKFGYDFSKVKIHTDSVAAKSAQSVNAMAYTSGNNIVFNQGQYAPGTESGKKLLAHELTHVVQQNSNPALRRSIQRSILEEVPHHDSTKDGVYTGSVDRYEYEDQAAYNERLKNGRLVSSFRSGNAKVRFDSNNCVFEIPLSVKFLNNDKDGQTSCESVGVPERARPVSQADFDKAKQRFMKLVPDSLNNWFNIHLGKPGVTGCNASNIPIKVILTQQDSDPDFEIILTENEGRSGVKFKGGGGTKSEHSGGVMTICGSARSDEHVLIHESGHMVLGAGDEYFERGKSKSRDRMGEHSRMAEDGPERLMQFHERHFQFATAFMNKFFPGCDATLVSGSRKIKDEITPEVSAGVVFSDRGNKGFVSLGVSLGIPLTKMRELTLTLGPQFGAMGVDFFSNRETKANITALLVGVRAGLRYRKRFGTFEETAVKLSAGLSGEAGLLRNFDDDPSLPGETFTPYLEGSASLGLEFSTRFSMAAEVGKGVILPGGSRSNIDYLKAGLRLGLHF